MWDRECTLEQPISFNVESCGTVFVDEDFLSAIRDELRTYSNWSASGSTRGKARVRVESNVAAMTSSFVVEKYMMYWTTLNGLG